MLVIDGINGVASCGQGDCEIVTDFLIIRVVALVQVGNVTAVGSVDAHAVQQRDEVVVALAIYLAQFYRYQVNHAEGPRVEEKEILVIAPENIAHVMRHDRLQLEDVSHKQQLLASKGLAHIARENPQYAVHKVDDVGPNHRNLVDDDEVQFAYEFDFLLGVTQHFAQPRCA